MRLAGICLVAAAAAACGFGDNTGHQLQADSTCGDAVKDTGESCDDGNRASGDGCSESCGIETPNPVCGNGVKEGSESCDDGNTSAGDDCTASCEVATKCGNTVADAGEGCDDGNTASGDGCSPTCQLEPAGACALAPQSGCSLGPTPACDLTEIEDGSTECRAVTFPGTSDFLCSSMTGCAAGYSCVGDIGVSSSCMKFCVDGDDCSGAGSRCVFDLVNDDGVSLNVKVCSNSCDLSLQLGCPTGLGCVGFDSTSGDYSDCRIMGDQYDGETCSSTVECRPGSVCVNATGTPRCYSYCKIGVAAQCGIGESCRAFADALTVGSTTYGFCE